MAHKIKNRGSFSGGSETKREERQSGLCYSAKYERRSRRRTWKTRVFSLVYTERIAILILEYRSARGLVFAKSGCNRGDRGISKRAKFKLAPISWRFSLLSPRDASVISTHAPPSSSHECTRSFFAFVCKYTGEPLLKMSNTMEIRACTR